MSKIPKTIHRAKNILRALNHPLRQNIINFLASHPDSYVKQIYTELNEEQAVISQQLRILNEVGLVTVRNNKKQRHYDLNYERIEQITSAVDEFLTK